MTRYPKKGKGSKWTALELKAIPASWQGDKLSEENLVGEVRVNAGGDISVRWLTSYRWEGKLKWFYCGTSPAAGLDDVRAKMAWAKDQIKKGINPDDRKALDRIEAQQEIVQALRAEESKKTELLTLGDLVDAWLLDGVQRQDGNKELRSAFETHLLTPNGNRNRLIRELSDSDLRKGLDALVKAGKNRQAVRVGSDLKQMFGWAEKRKPWRGLLIEGNPAALIQIDKVVADDYDVDYARDRILPDAELQELRALLEKSEWDYMMAVNKRKARQPLEKRTQLAIWIMLGTICRVGELSMAQWRHVDLEAGTWFIPKENQKKTNGKRADQVVWLSDFALHQFKALFAISGHSEFLFPSPTAKDGRGHIAVNAIAKSIGDRQGRFSKRTSTKGRRMDDSLVLGGGINGEWNTHDLRRTGATMMQKLGIDPDVIDRCQGHVLQGSKVRRSYLHHDYSEEKKAAWDRLGVRLQQVLTETPVAAKLRLAA